MYCLLILALLAVAAQCRLLCVLLWLHQSRCHKLCLQACLPGSSRACDCWNSGLDSQTYCGWSHYLSVSGKNASIHIKFPPTNWSCCSRISCSDLLKDAMLSESAAPAARHQLLARRMAAIWPRPGCWYQEGCLNSKTNRSPAGSTCACGHMLAIVTAPPCCSAVTALRDGAQLRCELARHRPYRLQVLDHLCMMPNTCRKVSGHTCEMSHQVG